MNRETMLERAFRWLTSGKTSVPEMIEEENEIRRRMMYERDVTYLLEDIERKYPSLIGRRDEIVKLLHSKRII